MPKKKTWSKLKITVLRQLDWGTFAGEVYFSVKWRKEVEEECFPVNEGKE